MADVYEFHVAGLIGPVVRGAMHELAVDPAERESVLSGSTQRPADIDTLLQRLDDSGIVPNQIRICSGARLHCATDQTQP